VVVIVDRREKDFVRSRDAATLTFEDAVVTGDIFEPRVTYALDPILDRPGEPVLEN